MLQVQLDLLLPQLCPEVRVCVYDNASPDATREVTEKYLAHGVSYFCAETNCGAGRNFFRCFEECQTEWIWLLSDDDPIADGAIASLLEVLRNQSCDFVHTYSWMSPYSSNITVSDIPSLFQHANIGSLTWISAGIYRTSAFRPLFRLFNEGISTWAPQLIVVLSLIESRGGSILLSPLKLTNPPTTPVAWSTLDGLLRLSLVPIYLERPANQQLVAERVFLDWFDDFFLDGLRETTHIAQIHKWHRVHKQVTGNLKAFHARGVGSYVFRNWYRAGMRKVSLRMAHRAILVKMLSLCPPVFFHSLIRILPLPSHVRERYEARDKFSAYY